jgi:arylsulfatase
VRGVIPEGGISNSLASGIDILPTLAEITSAPLPEHIIDGVSLLPILKGDVEAKPRETFYYYYRQNSLEAVRHGDGNWFTRIREEATKDHNRAMKEAGKVKEGTPSPVHSTICDEIPVNAMM